MNKVIEQTEKRSKMMSTWHIFWSLCL